MNQKLVQYEKNQEDIEELQNEVKQVESSIFERKKRLAQDEKELREVNMEIFMKVPNSLEGRSCTPEPIKLNTFNLLVT